MLVHDNMNMKWYYEALSSASICEVSVTEVEDDGKLLGERRADAYRKSSKEFICLLDSDDILIKGAIEKCIRFLDEDKGLCGVFTNSILIDGQGSFIKHNYHKELEPLTGNIIQNVSLIHQLAVMRREDVLPFLRYVEILDTYDQWLLYSLMSLNKKWKRERSIGYKWRQHDNSLQSTYPSDLRHIAKAKAYSIITRLSKPHA